MRPLFCACAALERLTALRSVLYLAWAVTPTKVLHSLGVDYHPTKWWALALPAWCCLAVLCSYAAYEGCESAEPAGARPLTPTVGSTCWRLRPLTRFVLSRTRRHGAGACQAVATASPLSATFHLAQPR